MSARLGGCRRGERGQVLIGVMALGLVVLILLTVATTALTNAIFSTSLSSDHTAAQQAAQSADSWIYSWLNQNPQELQQLVPAGSSGWLALQNPGQPDPLSSSASPAPLPSSDLPWLYPGQSGTLETCQPGSSYDDTCVQVQLRYSSPRLQVPSGDQTINEQVLVQARARTMCHSANPAGNAGCPTWTYQSLIRRRTFLDYLYFTNTEQVAPDLYVQAAQALQDGSPQRLFPQVSPAPPLQCFPSNGTPPPASTQGQCLQPVYGGAGTLDDTVDGPIHTNSQQVLVCGSPIFESPPSLGTGGGPYIEVAPGGASSVGTGPQCPPSGAVPTISAPQIPYPQGDQQLQQIAALDNEVLPGGTQIQGCSGAPQGQQGCAGHSSGAVLTLPGGQTVWLPQPPAHGVLYVTGDAQVAGQFAGSWTVGASGSITVGTGPSLWANNLWLACQGDNPAAPIPSTCNDMLGVVADQDIVLNDSNYQNSSAYAAGAAGQAVTAALMALGQNCGVYSGQPQVPDCGSIYSLQWDQAPPQQPPPPEPPGVQPPQEPPWPAPILVIQGAMVSYYRGLFGVFATSGTPAGAGVGIDYGLAKDFTYDARLLQQQPPWMLQPTASSWAIIGFTQTGATAG